MQLTAVFIQVPEGYAAFVEELPGANTQGATIDEARKNLREAVRKVLEANRELTEKNLAEHDIIKESFTTWCPRQVTIEWKLAPSFTDSRTFREVCKKLGGIGLYMVNDSQYSHGADCLVYIGETKSQGTIGSRIKKITILMVANGLSVADSL